MSEETKKAPAIRFQGFTDDWEQRKLREVGNVVTGSTPSTLDKTNYNGSYLFVSPADIQGNRYVDKTITTLSEKGFRKGRILKEGAILFVSIGSTIGKVAQIRQEAVTNQQINAVVPHEDYDDNFIFSSLVKESEKIRLLSATQAVPIINKTTFSNIDIHIPGNIKEQIQIGAFFKQLDDTIALHQRKLTLLEQLKQTYLQVMFPQGKESIPKLRFTDHSEPWEQRKLGEVGSVVMCKRIFKDQTTAFGDIPFYKIGTFEGSPDSFIPNDLFEEYKKNYPYPEIGDILMSASGTIGRTVVYEGEKAYYQDSNIVWLKTDKSLIDNSFLKQFYQVVKWSGLEGSTIKRLYNSNILSTGINLTSLREQTKLGTFFNQIDNTIALHQKKIAHLEALKSTLLNKMFI